MSEVQNLPLDQAVPIGIRNEDGSVIPIPPGEEYVDTSGEAHYAGRPDSVPVCIGQLVRIAVFCNSMLI